MFADPQVRHRGLVQYARDAELGKVPHIRTRINIGEGVRMRTVDPTLSQHNAEIFGRLGVSEAELRKLRAKDVLYRVPTLGRMLFVVPSRYSG
jgi:crotonobetainyl-CoA:carnitine CoA-transferase CaiB-like acyl-CoA transferase